MSYDGEICNECGLPVALGILTYWGASDELWQEVVGDDSIVLCRRCFAIEARAKKILVHWYAVA